MDRNPVQFGELIPICLPNFFETLQIICSKHPAKASNQRDGLPGYSANDRNFPGSALAKGSIQLDAVTPLPRYPAAGEHVAGWLVGLTPFWVYTVLGW